MKKVISLFLSLVMLLSITAETNLFAYALSSGDCYYDFNYSNGEKTAEITGCSSYVSNLVIPDSIDGCAVTSIEWYAFENCTNLRSVTIPDSVTSIGERAFQQCTNLRNITIGNGVTYISSAAFLSCENLSKTNYTGTIEKWCEITFKDYHSNPIAYSHNLYINDKLVTEANITNVERINNNVFINCRSLASVTISNDVTSIGDEAFRYCSSLKGVTIPDSVTSIGKSTFESCKSLASVTIPNGVTSIGESAFKSCTSMTSVTILDSVISIGNYVFYDCTSLTSLTIPNSVTSIGDSAFRSCTSLASLTIPSSVTSIGDSAFRSCTSLTSLTIPDSVTCIGESAFGNCKSLASITIPDSVTSIGDSAFNNCHVTDLIIANGSKSVTRTILLPFVKTLEHITISNSVTSIGERAFESCTSLTSVTIPSSVTNIGERAFESCTSLASLTIPNSVTSIGESTFKNCTNLTSVTIPSSVTNIGERAFDDCTSLTSITIPDSVINIGGYAFNNCANLTNIALFAENIGSFAFKDCTRLNKLTLSNKVKSVGISAFSGCTRLANVYFIGKKEQWNKVVINKDNDYLLDANMHYFCDHEYDNGKVTRKATCKATGIKTYTCKICGLTKTSVIDKTAHTYKNTITKATLTKNGKIVKKCTACGEVAKTTNVYYPKTIKLNKNSFVYNGKVQKPSVIVKDSKGKTLKLNTDYTVTYSNASSKNVGKYTVTIKMKGNYSGSKTIGYCINPKGTDFLASNKGGFKAISKGFTLKWNKQATQTTGYQIQYSTRKDFKNAATVTVANPKTTSYTIKGRAAKTRYYVRIRTYKKVSGKTFYSSWNSGTKSVVTLK